MTETLEWTTQLRRGVLEYCVLSLVRQRPHYGYELVTALSRWEPLAVTDGTLYPLLRRLQKAGLIDAAWHESPSGPPRKYYQLTAQGAVLLQAMTAEWSRLTAAISHLHADEEGGDYGPDGYSLPGQLTPPPATTAGGGARGGHARD